MDTDFNMLGDNELQLFLDRVFTDEPTLVTEDVTATQILNGVLSTEPTLVTEDVTATQILGISTQQLINQRDSTGM